MASAPIPSGPTPSPRQWRWHGHEFYGFLHFTTNTFTDKEWGFGDEKPAIFHPTDFDADAIVAVAREAGMRGLVLTCKHHDGFCLWPSAYTEHSVKNSPWRDGKGDVVREIADACGRQGLLFGVYLSPWDRNHADYGTPAYLDYYRNQLRELLTNYGPIFEVWHDGANGGDGWYGGANEKRTIDKFTYYDWENTWAIVRELQPEAVIFSDVGPDIRWVGNESGKGGETTWLTLNTTGWCPGFADTKELNAGHEDGPLWLPPEVDVSIRPGWFYHAREDGQVRSVRNLVDIYYQSVGRSGSLHLNLPPDRRGRIHETDVSRLRALRQILDRTFARDLAAEAAVTASSVRGDDPLYAASQILNDDPNRYWAADDETRAAVLELDLGEERAFDQVLLQEPVRLGQRVRAWALEAEIAGKWRELVAGTTIGYKRLARFAPVAARRVRLTIADAKACPLLSRLGLHLAPRFASEPSIGRAADGTVAFSDMDGLTVRRTTDGSEPTVASPVYAAPFALPDGGEVVAAVLAEDNPGVFVPDGRATARAVFGLAKCGWSVLVPAEGAAALVGDDPRANWRTGAREICLDLGQTVTVGALAYVPPRVARSADGFVQRCRWYVAAVPGAWGEPVAELRCDNVANNPVEQRVGIAPKAGRYVRLEVLDTIHDTPHAVFGGINVYRARQ